MFSAKLNKATNIRLFCQVTELLQNYRKSSSNVNRKNKCFLYVYEIHLNAINTMTSNQYTPKETLQLIKSGNEEIIAKMYKKYRGEFLLWIKNKYQCTDEEALDAYQESMLVFYNNIKKGKLKKFTSSIKTYLFAIGRNVVLYNRRKFQREQSDITDIEVGKIADSESAQINLQVSDNQKILIDTLNEMTNTCKSLILLYYTHNLPFKEIAKKLGYKSETVARMQKMRCMKKMKVLVKGRYKKEDLY